MVKFYKDISSLQVAVVVSINQCIQDFPAVGWIRGNNVATPDNIESKIEEYMNNHTVSKEDIEALFEGDTIVIDGGNAAGLVQNVDNCSGIVGTKSNTTSLKGAKKLVEEIGKILPKITFD